MLKVRDLTESLENKYNIDEGVPTLDELPFDEIMNKESTEGNMDWYEEDHPTWKRYKYKKEVDEAYEHEMEDELDYIMDDDSLSDDEKEQAISDLYSKYNYNESLNESFVEEWWGQTEDNPKDLQQYGLKVEPLKRKNDETLYRFSGSLEDINKARNDGYFYSLEIGEDENHSEDLNEALNEAVNEDISEDKIQKALQVLIDNGIDEDEAEIVLQAIGYTLLDKELFPEE